MDSDFWVEINIWFYQNRLAKSSFEEVEYSDQRSGASIKNTAKRWNFLKFNNFFRNFIEGKRKMGKT